MAKKKKAEIVEVVAKYDYLITESEIENMIFSIRGVQVMFDRDLAMLYGVETKVLNQAVKRNINRFPERFRFQLSQNETSELVTNCDRLRNASLKDLGKKWFAFGRMEIGTDGLLQKV